MSSTSRLSIALAQIHAVVGDVPGNVRRARSVMAQAAEAGADLVVLPELALLGYPPDDLLLRPDVGARCDAGLDELAVAAQETGVAVLAGAPRQVGGMLYNAAWLISGDGVLAVARKQVLPNYGVFDEKRYFEAADEPCVAVFRGCRLGILVCEDLWQPEPAAAVAAQGAEILLSIHASPYHWGKREERRAVAHARVRETGLPLVYVNRVGGQDDLVFDGESFALDADGREVCTLPPFEEAVASVDLSVGGGLAVSQRVAVAEPLAEAPSIYAAVELAIRDYVGSNGFDGVIVGLSGGIDSALTVALAADALGPDRVTAVMMPSRYTAQMSLDDAAAQAELLGVRYHVLSIEAAYEALVETLAPVFQGYPRDVTEENLQARCRGVLLMALSNKFHRLVLATGNKSEMAVGYATLYGDMSGGFAPLKDVSKTRVYALARWRNACGRVIPERVIEREPSAELAEDQLDTDRLPPYAELDPILEALVERDDAIEEIVARGFDEEIVRRVARMLVGAEYKRRQAAPGPKVTPRAFGRERRYPVTARYPF